MYHLIYNTYAKRGNSLIILEEFINILKRENYKFILHKTENKGHATEITKKVIESGGKYIIIIGGDGTVFEVLNGYNFEVDIIFGLIPAGTGNDVARMLSIPKNIEDAAKIIFENKYEKIDLLRINNSINSAIFASYGIAAEMVVAISNFKSKNKFSYIKSLLQKAWTHKPSKFKIEINGIESIYFCDYCGVHNGRWAGGGMELINKSYYDDGLSELIIIEYKGKFRRFLNLISLAIKKLHKQPNVSIFFIKSTKIKPLDNILCCMDGEPSPENELFVENIGKKLNLLKKL